MRRARGWPRRRGRRHSTALLVERGGYTVGPDSLAAALMAEAGLEPPPGAPAGLWRLSCRSKS